MIIHLKLHKLTLLLFLMGFRSKFKINLYHISIFLRLIPVFLSLLTFSVLVMYISMERLYAAKFAAAFYEV